MHALNSGADEESRISLSGLAGCLVRLLSPGYSAQHVNWLVNRTSPIDHRVHGTELLPLTRFRTEDDANALWERVAIELDERGVGPSNVRTDVDSIFEELALNAVQHSVISDNCYGIIQLHGDPPIRSPQNPGGQILYVVGVSDGGIGIPNSLRRNPLYAGLNEDRDAITRATDMDVTGTDSQRGAGLYHVMERVRAYRGELLIISGHGFLRSSDGETPMADSLSEDVSKYHAGTAVVAALPVPAMETT